MDGVPGPSSAGGRDQDDGQLFASAAHCTTTRRKIERDRDRMKTRRRFAFPQAMLAVVLIGGLPAAMGQTGNANDRPLLLPTRDVDVTYEIPQGSRTLAQRLRWIASARKLRVDPPIPDLFV